MIDVSIGVLIWFIMFLSVLLIGFTVYLTVKRIEEVSLQRKIEMFINENEQKWYRYLTGEEPFTDDLIPKDEYEIQGIEEIFLVYVKNFSNAEIQEKIKDFSNQFLKRHYQKLLESRKWSKKMNALYRVSDFQLDCLIDQCDALEKRKLSHEEHFQLLKIYSIYCPDRFVNKITTSAVKLSEFEYTELLIGLEFETSESLLDHFDELPIACQYSIIDTMGSRRDMDSIPFLESQLKHEDAENRIRSLKALHEIGIALHLEKYIPFLTSSVWEERLMVAKLLQSLPLQTAVPYLEKLLEDESWWVRSQAVQIIGNNKWELEGVSVNPS